MGYLVFPTLLVLLFGPGASAFAGARADFGRFANAVSLEIAIVETDGTVREGILRSATASELTMQFGANERIFQRDVIASAERLREGRQDGAIYRGRPKPAVKVSRRF